MCATGSRLTSKKNVPDVPAVALGVLLLLLPGAMLLVCAALLHGLVPPMSSGVERGDCDASAADPQAEACSFMVSAAGLTGLQCRCCICCHRCLISTVPVNAQDMVPRGPCAVACYRGRAIQPAIPDLLGQL